MRKHPSNARIFPIGYKCGDLEVISEKFVVKKRGYYKCKCSCGVIKDVRADWINEKQLVKSCGCKKNFYTSANHNKKIGGWAENGHKICCKCLKNKEVSEFNKHKANKDGYRAECKDCRYLARDKVCPIVDGFKFNKWMVKGEPIITEHVSKDNKSYIKRHFNCVCECGVEKIFTELSIKTGVIQSCGCDIIKIITPNKLEIGNCKFCNICEEYVDRNNFSYRNSYCDKCKDNYKLIRKFNITKEDYDKHLLANNGKCEVCKKDNNRVTKNGTFIKLCVDHCHSSGAFRGVICNACNTALGMVKDSKETLQNLINYLQKFEDSLNDSQSRKK